MSARQRHLVIPGGITGEANAEGVGHGAGRLLVESAPRSTPISVDTRHRIAAAAFAVQPTAVAWPKPGGDSGSAPGDTGERRHQPDLSIVPRTDGYAGLGASNAVVQFIAQQVPEGTAKAVERAERQFTGWLWSTDSPCGFASARTSDLLDFLLARLRRGDQVSTLRSIATNIDKSRKQLGLAGIAQCDAVRAFFRAASRARPSRARLVGYVPYAPRVLLPVLPRGRDFDSVRNRALFALRVDTLMRPGEPATIRRSSIRPTVDPLGRPVVVFVYNSKRSAAQHVAADSNYAAHVHDGAEPGDGASALVCPACLLLALKQRVVALPAASEHDCVFTSADGEPLSRDRLSSIVTGLLRAARLPNVFTAHSLRAACNQSLQLAGVSVDEIALRAGWAGVWSSSSQRTHYTHHRFVRAVFARILLCDGMDSLADGRRCL